MHYFLYDMCTLIERWCIVAVEQQTKIPFPIAKEVLEQIFNTRVGLCQIYVQKRTFTDHDLLPSAVFD